MRTSRRSTRRDATLMRKSNGTTAQLAKRSASTFESPSKRLRRDQDGRKTRYVGIGNNELAATMVATAHNLIRIANLLAQPGVTMTIDAAVGDLRHPLGYACSPHRIPKSSEKTAC